MVSTTQHRSQPVQMHTETISPTCLRLISKLGRKPFCQQFYLVGGTALSLQVGHRESIDLDFFSTEEFDARSIISELKQVGDVENVTIKHNDAQAFVDGVKVNFLYFAYPPIHELIDWQGIRVMSANDIGLFKLLAILGRNRKKDIIDLYFIDREVMPMEELFTDLTSQYAEGDVNLFKQLEILFDDSEIKRSDMPKMLKPIDFEAAYRTVKEKLVKSIRNYFQL